MVNIGIRLVKFKASQLQFFALEPFFDCMNPSLRGQPSTLIKFDNFDRWKQQTNRQVLQKSFHRPQPHFQSLADSVPTPIVA
jgi:hypothetical protein